MKKIVDLIKGISIGLCVGTSIGYPMFNFIISLKKKEIKKELVLIFTEGNDEITIDGNTLLLSLIHIGV